MSNKMSSKKKIPKYAALINYCLNFNWVNYAEAYD